MKVTVLFFGATAVSAGVRRAELDLPEKSASADALEQIFSRFPTLRQKHEGTPLLFAVNHSYAKGDEVLEPGDELAVFTAVSGG